MSKRSKFLKISGWTALVWGFILAYIITFGLLSAQRHLAFESNALDLGNYDQALWNLVNGRGLTLTMLPDISLHRMGLHVEPILYLLAPLYWLWPSPLVLVWIQSFALGVAGWPLYLLARQRLGQKGPAVAIVLAYLLLPATQSINMFDFHAVALSPPLMLTALYFLDRYLASSGPKGFWDWGIWRNLDSERNISPPLALQKRGETVPPPNRGRLDGGLMFGNSPTRLLILTLLFFTLALATKEDIPLHVFMVGLYLTFLLRRWRIGLLLAGLGLFWAGIAFGWIIPAFRVGGEQSAYVNYFPTLGQTPLEIALSPLTQPGEVLAIIFRSENLRAMRMLVLPFGGLNLFGLPIFLLAAPSLAISLLSNNPLQQELETWHYAAPMLPFISLAAVDGLYRLGRWGNRWLKHPQIILVGVLVMLSLGYHILRGYSPLALPFRWPQVTAHHQLGHDIAQSIPQNVRIKSQAELAPHVSQRETLRIWRGRYNQRDKYVFVDISHPRFVNQDNAQGELLSTLIYNENFGVVRMEDGYLLLQEGAERVALEPTLQSFMFADSSWRTEPQLGQFANLMAVVGVEAHINREQEPQVTLYFHALRRPAEEHFLHLYVLNEMGQVFGATTFKQPAMVWWPPQLWHQDSVVKVRFNTLPWWTNDGQTPRFSYALAVSTNEDPWLTDARLLVSGPNALPDNLLHVQSFWRLAGMAYQE